MISIRKRKRKDRVIMCKRKESNKGSLVASKLIKFVTTLMLVLFVAGFFSLNANAAQTDRTVTFDADNNYLDSASVTALGGYNYKLNLTTSGRLTVRLESIDVDLGRIHYNLSDVNNQQLKYGTEYKNNNTGKILNIMTIDLCSGDYTYSVTPASSGSTDYGAYDIRISFIPSNESVNEGLYGINETTITASPINVNTEYISFLAQNETADTYKFTLTAPGRVSVRYTDDALIDSHHMDLYIDNNGNPSKLTGESYYKNNTLTGNFTYVLTAGTYYLQIRKGSGTGTVKFTINHSSARESFPESLLGQNNSVLEPNSINVNTNYISAIGLSDEADCFKFTVPKYGRVNFAAFTENDAYSANYKIYGPNDFNKTADYGSSFTRTRAANGSVDLKAGTYVVKLSGSKGYQGGNAVINFKVNFHVHSFTKDVVHSKASYCTTVSSTSTWYDGLLGHACSICNYEDTSLREPIYAVKTIKLDKTTKLYDGKNFKPNVIIKDRRGKTLSADRAKITMPAKSKEIGVYKATYKLSTKYYNQSGLPKLTYEVVPKETTVKSVKASRRKVTVTVAAQKKYTNGYEIEYSYYKDFKYGVNKVDLSKNTKTKASFNVYSTGKLYVRVRTYKKVGKTKVYSKYSPVKSVTIR